MIQYGGQGVSVARQYYLARKRSDETPLEYLHRLNVAATHAKIAIKEERQDTSATRREHVEHFIATLNDRLLVALDACHDSSPTPVFLYCLSSFNHLLLIFMVKSTVI